ncbi:PilZ domain-containing protein [Methylobacterium nigriterrae]|uniref:PilZ domain-containing protein n=1 Tax=Methylobacterium nigriterrae TaxID=3127512 RepID=UPI00301417EC
MNEVGSVAIDEHTTIPCLIFDQSGIGVRLTLVDASLVPDTFVLMADHLGEARICTAAWRTAEEIGAFFGRPAERPGFTA